MESRTPGLLATPATRVVLKVIAYYAVLIALGWVVLNKVPSSPNFALGFESVLNSGQTLAEGKKASLGPVLDEPSRAVAVAAAMTAAILLSRPVAWIYQLTRAKKGYQQSVVQLMIILPLVVSGVVILVS